MRWCTSACRRQTMASRWRVAEARGRGMPVVSRCQLVEAIQQLGYLPRQGKNSTIVEKHLAVRLIKARTAGLLSSEQEAALGHLAQGAAEVKAASVEHLRQQVGDRDWEEILMHQVRDLGRSRGSAEQQLAEKLRRAWKAKRSATNAPISR